MVPYLDKVGVCNGSSLEVWGSGGVVKVLLVELQLTRTTNDVTGAIREELGTVIDLALEPDAHL